MNNFILSRRDGRPMPQQWANIQTDSPGIAPGSSWADSGGGGELAASDDQGPIYVWVENPLAQKQQVAAANTPILSELAELDAYIPRGLEDTWAATNFDTSRLPFPQLQRLARKKELRAQLK